MLPTTQMSRSATQAQSLPAGRSGTERLTLSTEAALPQHQQLLTGLQGEQNPAVVRPTASTEYANTEKVLDSLAIGHTIRVKKTQADLGMDAKGKAGMDADLIKQNLGPTNPRTITMEKNCTSLTAPCLPRLQQLVGEGVTKGIGAASFSKSSETWKATQRVIGRPELQSKVISIYTHICVNLFCGLFCRPNLSTFS